MSIQPTKPANGFYVSTEYFERWLDLDTAEGLQEAQRVVQWLENNVNSHHIFTCEQLDMFRVNAPHLFTRRMSGSTYPRDGNMPIFQATVKALKAKVSL